MYSDNNDPVSSLGFFLPDYHCWVYQYEDNTEIISSTTAFESSGSDILWSFDFIVLDSVNNSKNMFYEKVRTKKENKINIFD